MAFTTGFCTSKGACVIGQGFVRGVGIHIFDPDAAAGIRNQQGAGDVWIPVQKPPPMPGRFQVVPLIGTAIRLAEKGGSRLPMGLFRDEFSKPAPEECIRSQVPHGFSPFPGPGGWGWPGSCLADWGRFHLRGRFGLTGGRLAQGVLRRPGGCWREFFQIAQ